MSETLAKMAYQALLRDHEADLLAGTVRFGVQRSFAHMTRSALTPPTAYYYVVVVVERKRLEKFFDPANDWIEPPKRKFYNMSMTLIDYVNGVTGEGELFQTMQDDFDNVTERIMDLIESDQEITYTAYEGGPAARFRLNNDREIAVDITPTIAEDEEAILVATFTFEVQLC